MSSTANFDRLKHRFRDHVAAREFCCLGAKAALARDQITQVGARSIISAEDDFGIHHALTKFVARQAEGPVFSSFVALFEGPGDLTEIEFEAALWQRVQALTNIDAAYGYKPDPRVSADPRDPNFSLSFAGKAFFVVGLHPGSSRQSRRFVAPALVFNLHQQFEQLRQDGRYATLRAKIIDRDVAQSGSVNPMLALHGTSSEARQYSGRSVDESWACPLSRPSFDVADAA